MGTWCRGTLWHMLHFWWLFLRDFMSGEFMVRDFMSYVAELLTSSQTTICLRIFWLDTMFDLSKHLLQWIYQILIRWKHLFHRYVVHTFKLNNDGQFDRCSNWSQMHNIHWKKTVPSFVFITPLYVRIIK